MKILLYFILAATLLCSFCSLSPAPEFTIVAGPASREDYYGTDYTATVDSVNIVSGDSAISATDESAVNTSEDSEDADTESYKDYYKFMIPNSAAEYMHILIKNSDKLYYFDWLVILLIFLVILVFAAMIFLFNANRERRANQILLKAKSEELEAKNRQLEKATQSKLSFFTNVSHDLRTPLTLIAEPLSMLAEDRNLTANQRNLATMAVRNVNILTRLVCDILDFRKYDNGKLVLRRSMIDIASLLAEWVASFESAARHKDIRLSTDIASGMPMLSLDRNMMERIAYNLISNAIKYTPANGKVGVSCFIDVGMLVLRVTDTGIGISKEDCCRIFDNFYQVDKEHPNGSGIGLALTNVFVSMHNGRIEVHSEKGRGSEFTVYIPSETTTETASVHAEMPETVYRSNGTAAEAHIATPEESGHIKIAYGENSDAMPRLLVVDDNNDMLALISGIMGDEFEVHRARNGYEGMAMATRLVPDLIISDVMMPEMDGYELCRRLKDEMLTSHIPILLVTACGLDEQRSEGFDCGADGYLAKPFSAQVLKSQCRSLTQNRRRILNLWENSVYVPHKDTASAGSKSDISALDDPENKFYERFVEIFTERMGDSALSVEEIAAEMGLGHSQFYRKLKTLTNYTPVELMRRLRLQRARELLLTHPSYTISEITYRTGFTSPAYFTKCFRVIFGETPSALRNRFSKHPHDIDIEYDNPEWILR